MKYTKQDLQSLIDQYNAVIGKTSGEVGSIQYYKDYFGYKLHELSNEHGGVRDWAFGNESRSLNDTVSKLKTVLMAERYFRSYKQDNI